MRSKLVLLISGLFFSAILHAQGVKQLWGTTQGGGVDGAGVIFSLKGDGTGYNKRYDFNTDVPGLTPWYTDMEVSGGKLWGVTFAGGAYNYGVLFTIDPTSNTYQRKFDFNSNTGAPYGVLAVVSNKVFGITSHGGINNAGIIYEFDLTTNIFTKKADFSATTGINPVGGIIYLNGNLYGLTQNGGSNSAGTLYEFNLLLNTLTKKIDLINRPGEGNVLCTNGNKIYGVLQNSCQIFEYNQTTNTFQAKYTVPANAVDNQSGLTGGMTYLNNKFYSTAKTYNSGLNSYQSFIFEWDPIANTYIKKFDLSHNIPNYEAGGFRLSTDGTNLFGVTYKGGIYNKGYVFIYSPLSNILTNIASIPLESEGPTNSTSFYNNKIYGCVAGTTAGFPDYIFEVDLQSSTLQKEFQFSSGTGAYPLIPYDVNGSFYYTTYAGGLNNKGILGEFKRSTNTNRKRVDWNSGPGVLSAQFDSKVLGLNLYDGINNLGQIFQWDTILNVIQPKYDFSNQSGEYPNWYLSKFNNKYYGTTGSGGINNSGVIFEWDPISNSFTKKYDFNSVTGASPTYGGLTLYNNKFYGLTRSGGANNKGVIFEWDPVSNSYTKRYDFPANGFYRNGNLVEINGKLYGVESSGNPGSGYGYLYEWNPVSALSTIKYSFTSSDHGTPTAQLQSIGTKIFGTTYSFFGEYPSIFQYDVSNNQFTTSYVFDGVNGTPGDGNAQIIVVPAVIAFPTPNICSSFPSITIDNSNNNVWVPITNEYGDVIAEIKANGNNLGVINTSVYIHNGSVREDASKNLYLNRSFSITPQFQPTTTVDLRLYITDEEFTALKNATNSQGQPSGINTINDITVFKNNDACNNQVIAATSQANSANITYDGGGYVLTAAVTSFSSFYIGRMNIPTSVRNITDAKNLTVYPNPVSSLLVVDFKQPAQKVTFRIVTETGQIMHTETAASVMQQHRLHVKHLKNGYYILEVNMNGASRYIPFVKN
jgi:uncharacterized repeat protein (TIGR03803 family)